MGPFGPGRTFFADADPGERRACGERKEYGDRGPFHKGEERLNQDSENCKGFASGLSVREDGLTRRDVKLQ